MRCGQYFYLKGDKSYFGSAFGPLTGHGTVGENVHLATTDPLKDGRTVGNIFHLATFGTLCVV